MKVSFDRLRAVALGAVNVAETAQGVRFYRFTEEQLAFYADNPRSTTSAGVRLRFRTDSTTLGLTVVVTHKTSRSFFSMDVLVNGAPIGYLDNIGDTELWGNSNVELPIGRFAAEFDLGVGEKEVCIHFPWSVGIALEALTLDDGASVIPVKPTKRFLVFGDSITQGYDAKRPSNRYAAQVCDAFDAEEVNKAIGGEFFVPPLAAMPDGFTPDLIWVAYGTNDWSMHTDEQFHADCRAFYEALCATYAGVPIVAVTPIGRVTYRETACGRFEELSDRIRKETAHLPQVTVVEGLEFVPTRAEYFGDKYLHPNDDGFAHYAHNLTKALTEVIHDRL